MCPWLHDKPRKVRGSLSVALESLKFILECLNIFGSAGDNRCLVAVEFRISNHANIFRYMQIFGTRLSLIIFHDTDWSSCQERSLFSFMTCHIGNLLKKIKGHPGGTELLLVSSRVKDPTTWDSKIEWVGLGVPELDKICRQYCSSALVLSYCILFVGCLFQVMSHEWKSIYDGREDVTTCARCLHLNLNIAHLLRFWSFGAFVWSFGRCPKWRWIFHVFFVRSNAGSGRFPF